MNVGRALAPYHQEIANWPGANLEPVRVKRHIVVRVTYGDSFRTLTVAKSAGDSRTHRNTISDMRKLLTQLGAERTTQ